MGAERDDIIREFVRIAVEGSDPFAASEMLRTHAPEVVGAVVVFALAHHDASVRLSAAIAAREAEVRDAYEPLVRLLQDPQIEVRLEAIGALAAIQVPAAWKPLALALDDLELRDEAARALGVLRAVEAVPALAEAAIGPEEQVQISAIESLGMIGTTEAVAAAAAALDEEADNVIGAAARVVAQHRFAAALPKLLALSESLPAWSRARQWVNDAIASVALTTSQTSDGG